MFDEIFERGSLNSKIAIRQIKNIFDALEKINYVKEKGKSSYNKEIEEENPNP